MDELTKALTRLDNKIIWHTRVKERAEQALAELWEARAALLARLGDGDGESGGDA